VTTAFDSKSKIGWGGFVRGFVASEWVRTCITLSGGKLPVRWGTLLHRAIFDSFLWIWSIRNTSVHGTAESQRVRVISLLDTRIQELYDRSVQLLPADRARIFPLSLDSLRSRLRQYRRQWTEMAAREMEAVLARAALVPRGQQQITSFFKSKTGLADDPP